MKKTKKMLAAMLAVSTLAAALSGCSGGNKTDGSLEFTEAASARRKSLPADVLHMKDRI